VVNRKLDRAVIAETPLDTGWVNIYDKLVGR
jgi:hypothetical protein